MISTLRNAWKVPELRRRMLFTLAMLFVFRIGSNLPVPYMNRELIQAIFSSQGQGGLLGFLDMMGGGSLSRFSVFATNIYPYITASIILQLLTIAIPRLEEIAKEGEEGSKKIAKYTKYLAIVLALVQALGMSMGFFRGALTADTFMQKSIVVITLVSGTAFLMWLGEQITEKGIGNGVSLIIFIGIISGMPASLIRKYQLVRAGYSNIIKELIYIAVIIFIVAMVVALQEGERRVNVSYAKRVVGRKMYGGQNTHIPIKVSMAGVMPVIFASSILALPQTIALLTKSAWMEKWLTPQGSIGIWVYSIVNILLIMFFTYFYTAIQFNTVEYSKNLQQNGGFIPGIRPGRPTSEHLDKIVNRLTFVGGISLAILASLPIILSKIFQMQVGFGGTGIIIVVGVVLETVKQIEAQLMMRHYKGFLN